MTWGLCVAVVYGKHLIRLHRCADTFSRWRRLIVACVLAVAIGYVRGRLFSDRRGRRSLRWWRVGIFIRSRGGCARRAFTDRRGRRSLQCFWGTEQNGYRINVRLHPSMSEPVVREVSVDLFCVSSFREKDGAAICRRLPREMIGHREPGNASTTSARRK